MPPHGNSPRDSAFRRMAPAATARSQESEHVSMTASSSTSSPSPQSCHDQSFCRRSADGALDLKLNHSRLLLVLALILGGLFMIPLCYSVLFLAQLIPAGGHLKPARGPFGDTLWSSSFASPRFLREQSSAAHVNPLIESEKEAFECDRSSPLTDWCLLQGDVRVDLVSGEVVLKAVREETPRGRLEVKPYPRKWDYPVMGTISKVHLQSTDEDLLRKLQQRGGAAEMLQCTRHNEIPAVVLSVGGYSGMVFHDFNEVLLPLFQTVHEYRGEVVIIITDLKGDGWFRGPAKQSLMAQMTKYPIRILGSKYNADGGEQEVECFPKLIVGLKHNLCMYDEWGGRQERDEVRAGIKVRDFARRISKAYELPAWAYEPESNEVHIAAGDVPVLGLIQRVGTRKFSNFDPLEKAARQLGFKVLPLSLEYMAPRDIVQVMRALDVMVGVHGGAFSNTLFMRPRSVIIQVMPFGEYGERTVVGHEYKNIAESLAASYMEWHVPKEHSSLFTQYNESEAVLADPGSLWDKDPIMALSLYHSQDVSIPPVMFKMLLRHALRTLAMQTGITADYPRRKDWHQAHKSEEEEED